jgi:hypothetical protein
MRAGAESERTSTITADGFEVFRLDVVLGGRGFVASFRRCWPPLAGFATSQAKLDPLGRDHLPFDLFGHRLNDEDAEATGPHLAVLGCFYFAAQGTERVFCYAQPAFFQIFVVWVLLHPLNIGDVLRSVYMNSVITPVCFGFSGADSMVFREYRNKWRVGSVLVS